MIDTRKKHVEQMPASHKIRTGQSFLYRKDGLESQVLEIRMKEDIVESKMASALSKTLERYPYLSSRLVEIEGDFYPVKNELPMLLRKGKNLFPLGGEETNFHLIDINYEAKTIFISYFHGLCDGRGIMPFVRTLLYYYFSMVNAKIMKVPNVRRATDSMLVGEEAEPGFVKLELEDSGELPKIQRQGYSIPEAACQKERMKESYRYEIRIESNAFLKYIKSIQATPAIAFALLFSSTIQELRASDDNEPIVCNLVSDLRSGIGMENTYRNCVSSLELPMTSEAEDYPNLAIKYRQMIKEYKKPENIQKEFQKIITLCDKLDTLPSFEEKQQALSFFDTLLSNTYVLSYIGQTNFGECEEHIEAIHTYSSGSPGLSLEVLATREYFFIDLMQSFSDDKYVLAFAETLENQGLDVEVSEAIRYSTPRDRVRTDLN